MDSELRDTSGENTLETYDTFLKEYDAYLDLLYDGTQKSTSIGNIYLHEKVIIICTH